MAAINSGSDDTPSTYGSSVQLMPKIPHILPHERVFPIQIGSELFKLSGASISSDGASLLISIHRIPSHYVLLASAGVQSSSVPVGICWVTR